ncbi:MAG: tetratricopeptide repeat protein [Lentisphaerae bacterium]|nr:tetratricopeptide repeat protein [Lentisphaerota bacterium]
MRHAIGCGRPAAAARALAWIAAGAALTARCLCAANPDVTLPDAERNKLDRFAERELARADKNYRENAFRQAAAEYEAFVQQFPDSPAAPYARLQKARSLQLGGDSVQALRLYEDLLDYYPELVSYAAPALYFSAECRLQDRDTPGASRLWMEMATDPDYRRHPLTAAAINQLAPQLAQEGKAEEALKLYRQSAVDFRSVNPDQAFRSLNALVEHYTLNAPNEPELRKLFKETGGFERAPRAIVPNADVEQDRQYWQGIWERVWARANSYTLLQNELKSKLLAYWAEAFKGRFPDWKEYQDQLAAFAREAAFVP